MSPRYLRSFCRTGLSSLFRGRTKRLLCFCVAFALLYLIFVSVLKLPKQSGSGFLQHPWRARSGDGGHEGIPRQGSGPRDHDIRVVVGENRSFVVEAEGNIQAEQQALDLLGADNNGGGGGTGSPLKPFDHDHQRLRLCPELRDNHNLTGHVGQASLLIEDLDEEEISLYHPELQPGGRWKPEGCVPRHKVAIIIPYRDRKSHLNRLLDFLIPMLEKQLLDFRFIVTEQYGDDLFNKGRIMNAAFKLARKLGVRCVIFHDVDMFPQDDRSPYDCPPMPRHLGAYVSNLGYQLWYQEIVGGALAIRVEDYEQINGFSNSYWAWGGEDDDMGKRIMLHNFTIERPNSDYVRFSMLKHVKRKRLSGKLVYKLLDEAEKRWTWDGLNETDKWKIVRVSDIVAHNMQRLRLIVVKVDIKPLYYHLLVDVGDPPDGWKDS